MFFFQNPEARQFQARAFGMAVSEPASFSLPGNDLKLDIIGNMMDGMMG